MVWIAPVATLIATAIAAGLATGAAIPFLQRRSILDYPIDRSSHASPTPRGGGLAVVPVCLLAWAVIAWNPGPWHAGVARPGLAWVLGAAAFLGAVSWLDDLRGLSPAIRLAAQIAAVGLVLGLAPAPGPYFQSLLPPALDLVAAGFFLVWFVNLFNFMDGIDGLAGSETGSIGLGVVLIAQLAGLEVTLVLLGAAICGAGIGFLKWNWQPARIFLGDVGSVPLGFLLGWLLLELAAAGQWMAALILPLYYLADATLTLIRRIFRGQRPWRAHREHFYQLAVSRGGGHARVTGWVILANFCLLGLALASIGGSPWLVLGGAVLVVLILIIHFARRPVSGGDAGP